MGLSTTASAVVVRQGRILGKDRSLISIAGSTTSMVAKAAERIERMRDAHDITIPLVGLTVAVPAVVTDKGQVLAAAEGIKFAGNTFRKRLEDELGVPVGLINDARASFAGESVRGGAVEASSEFT